MLFGLFLANYFKNDQSRWITKQKVSKHDLAWYYIRTEKPMTLNEISKQIKIESDLILPISSHIFTAPLTHYEASRLYNISNFFVKKIPSKDKKGTHSEDHYIAICPPSCQLPGVVVSRTNTFSIFKYEGNVKDISKTACIRSFAPFSLDPQFHTRFHYGLTHNSDYNFGIGTDDYRSKSTLQMNGITGSGECIAIVDSGLDTNNSWFSKVDSNGKLHNKVRFYADFADNIDGDGHGTFIAGIAAGKGECSPQASYYDGIAPDANLFIVDIHNSTTDKILWPTNFNAIFEAPLTSGCKIHLNTWTTGDPILTTVIDYIAYNNPYQTIIFPAESNIKSQITSPADAKNIITVGSTFGHPASRSFDDPTAPVIVFNHNTNKYYTGFGDPNGRPLLRTNRSDVFNLLIDDDICFSEPFTNCSAAFLFSPTPLTKTYNIPLIHLSPTVKSKLNPSDRISIYPSPLYGDGSNSLHRIRHDSGYTTTSSFLIKPDIVAPGGPMIGPRAGSNGCVPDGLTMNEGPSVSAAVIAGDAALIRQFYRPTIGNIPSTMVKAILVHSAANTTDTYDEKPSINYGWGTPQLDNILYPSGTVFMEPNGNIKSSENITFCFTLYSDSPFAATLVWNDYPRDPASVGGLTTPLHLGLVIDKQNDVQIMANNKENDAPTVDHFNNVQHLEIKGVRGQKLKLIVYADQFEYFNSTNFSLIATGSFPKSRQFNCQPRDAGLLVTCPKKCGRAKCGENFKCKCPDDRGGDFCTFKREKAILKQWYSLEEMKKFEIKFYKVVPDTWKKGTSLKIEFQKQNKNEFGVIIQIGKLPTFTNYICSLDKCPHGKIEDDSLELDYEDWDFVNKENPFEVGIFKKIDDPYARNEVRFSVYNSGNE